MDPDLLIPEQTYERKPALEAAAEEIARLLRDVELPEDIAFMYSEQLDFVAFMILWLSSAKYEEITESCSYNECLLKLVKCWIKSCPDASWRWLIWKLDYAENITVADQIRNYAEPLTDPTLTYDNVLRALESLQIHHWRYSEAMLYTFLRIPFCVSENKSEFIQWWLNYSPFASWEELAGQLYHIKVLPKALKCAKQSFDHIPDPTLTLSSICVAFKDENDWEIEDCERLSSFLDLPHSILPDTDINTDALEYRKTLFKLFLENHPAPSWQLVARAAYAHGADNATELILHKYIQGLSLQELCTQAIFSFVPSEDIDELPLPKRMKLMINGDSDS